MKLMKTTEAVGQMLCHDITQIIPGITKDAVFRKGHIIREEDIPVLLSVGKEHVYIWEQNENMLHENDAAAILRDLCMGEHMKASQPKEGKIELTAACDGLFLADLPRLRAINGMGRMMLSALREKDIPTVMAGVIITAIMIALGNLVADLLYGVVDPRIRAVYTSGGKKLKKKEAAA